MVRHDLILLRLPDYWDWSGGLCSTETSRKLVSGSLWSQRRDSRPPFDIRLPRSWLVCRLPSSLPSNSGGHSTSCIGACRTLILRIFSSYSLYLEKIMMFFIFVFCWEFFCFSTLLIYLRKKSGTSHHIQHVIKPQYQKTILDGNLINYLTVNAHPPWAILLRQKERGTAQGLKLSLMKPLSSSSSTCLSALHVP